jgi:hypothetical protein
VAFIEAFMHPRGTFTRAVDLERQQIPNAFAIGGPLPYSNSLEPAPTGYRMGTPRADEALDVARTAVMENLLPVGGESMGDLETAIKELGFQAIAFYVSFHRPTEDGHWGIFYWDHRVRQLAAKIRGELRGFDAAQASTLALEILRRHEAFHFRFDVYALHQELATGKPLYNRYSTAVYRQVRCTAECFEEALANRACVYSRNWPDPDPVRKVTKRLGAVRFPSRVRGFLERLCREMPPGYRDFGSPLSDLREGLGGQLMHGCNGVHLPEPQARWVGHAGPFRKLSFCPESVLVNPVARASDVPQFRLRAGGHIWDFHKGDQDTWPSSPHGPDYEDGSKLSLADGKIYNVRTRKAVGREKLERLKQIRQECEHRWPDVPLPVLQIEAAL